MASKGQKFLNYTEEEKNEIIQKYCNGETSGYQLAKQYGIPVSTVNGKIKCRNSVKNFVGFPTFFIC